MCDGQALITFLRDPFVEHFLSFLFQVEGPVLRDVAVDAKLRAGDPFLVDLHASEIRLKLNREQLTLLLDVMNENLAGLGYTPNAIQLRAPSHASTDEVATEDDSSIERNVVQLLCESTGSS